MPSNETMFLKKIGQKNFKSQIVFLFWKNNVKYEKVLNSKQFFIHYKNGKVLKIHSEKKKLHS